MRPYELRIGVTGHRSVAHSPALAHALRRLLDDIAQALSTAPVAWIVISPLALGADRLVAEAVLEQPGATLEAIVPFPLAEYRIDFDGSADRAAFEGLLVKAARVHELAGDPSNRASAYLRVGERVVDACEIIIALWDGQPSKGVGGTTDIVAYAVDMDRVVIWLDPACPQRAPRVVETVRVTDEGIALTSAWWPVTAKHLSPGFWEYVAYHQDEAVSSEALQRAADTTRGQLTREATSAGIGAEALAPLWDAVIPAYVRADQLAMRYQRRHIGAVNGVLYLAAAGLSVAVTQVLFFPEQPWIILFEVAAMLAVFVVWWMSQRRAWHRKWLHGRFLAERLRTFLFTTLVASPADGAARVDPLPFYGGPHHWLVDLVQGVEGAANATAPRIPFAPLRTYLAAAWLHDQQAFQARNATRKAHRAHRRHQVGFILFGTTLVMAVLHMFGVGHGAEAHAPSVLQPALWITALALVLPVWAGAIHAGTSQLELERIAERSHRMAHALDVLAQRAREAQTPEALGRVVHDAEALMTMETHEWWVLLSFQDVRLHV